jgi:hypothetical protein
MVKSKVKKSPAINQSPTVSILTISQLSRWDAIQVLNELIKRQTYHRIIEWVICEGSKTEEEASQNKELIKTLKSDIPINYIDYTGKKLGGLRNVANTTAKGEICVNMDDDDAYFPTYIEHAVNKLVNSKAEIAGCTKILVYDWFLNKLVKFKGFPNLPNHSTNNAIAFKRSYLKNNKHDENAEITEETSFTKNYTNEMVQLESEKSLICNSHCFNTFNKRELFISGIAGINSTLEEVKDRKHFMTDDIFNKYKAIFVKDDGKVSPYDITYYTGGFCVEWNPNDKSITGSEQAIKELSEAFVKNGKSVIVYANINLKQNEELILNGVVYKNWKEFPYQIRHNNLIIWRLYGMLATLPYDLKANKYILDLHDTPNNPQFINLYNEYGYKIDNIMFKSKFHKEEFEKVCQILKCSIIPNGVRKEHFKINPEPETKRDPYKFIYCSCYLRALPQVLTKIWPIIYKEEPRATLHCFYGYNHIQDENIKNQLKLLLATPGCVDRGRQPMDLIIREKYNSSFHLYPTLTNQEIDCISIKESVITSTIPLIANYGCFKERDGIHYNLNNDQDYEKMAYSIVKMLKDNKKVEEYRNYLSTECADKINDWNDTAKEWLSVLSN